MSDEDPDAPSDGEGPTGSGSRIRALDESTVQRIAAGEVVERPASVVKELVENSLDADASRVSVAVQRGGKDGVRVRDDGVGMTADELAVAVEEHTTSKIRDVDDLEAGVGTLGFRGEALSTIGAVSRLTVRSRPRDARDAGAEITVEGGTAGPVRPVGCPEGTTVEVADLFYNTPARKKFLKRDATEFDHVNTVVSQYALANPEVAVSLDHDGREVFATEGNGDLQSSVLAVYGREVAEAMVEVDAEPADRDGPVEAVRGLASHPETTRSGREYLSTFVNGRYVTAATLREAVLDAYGGQLAPDRYPFAVLFVDVPAEEVDVNVHPRKMEVRFDDEAGVKRAVRDAVEGALLDHGLVRSTAPRGRSAPDQTEVAPESADGEVVGGAGTSHETSSGVEAGRSRTDRTPTRVEGGASAEGEENDGSGTSTGAEASAGAEAGTDRETDAGAATADPDPSATGADPTRPADDAESTAPGAEPDPDPDPDAWSVETTGSEADAGAEPRGSSADGEDDARSAAWDDWVAQGERETGPTEPADADATGDEASPDVASSGVSDADGSPTDSSQAPSSANGPERPSPRPWQADPAEGGADGTPADPGDGARSESAARGFAAPTTQRTLAGDDAGEAATFDRLPRMRVLGQLRETYIVAETPDGLVLVDQHAADERVNYERLRREVRGDAPTQALAEPVDLELTAREAALFDEYDAALSRLGFRAERTGERTVEVGAVPAVFDAALDPELLRDALTAFVAEGDDGGRETVDAVADALLADLACYPSITGNTSLTEGSVVDLLTTLDGCENPYACPHGRPVVIRFDDDEIADRFERDYPGHAGRRSE